MFTTSKKLRVKSASQNSDLHKSETMHKLSNQKTDIKELYNNYQRRLKATRVIENSYRRYRRTRNLIRQVILESIAVTIIQTHYRRRLRIRCQFRQVIIQSLASTIIQKAFRNHLGRVRSTEIIHITMLERPREMERASTPPIRRALPPFEYSESSKPVST